ncbi:MAG TPA: hypothetical protein VER55_13950, partial [Ardenticatenaceae bacterium]|nr:hypothetical protein [Ardenticatenaceae bacterium]
MRRMKTRSIQRWLQAAVLILPLTLAAACGPTIAPTAVRGDTGLPAAETPQAEPATPTDEPEAEPSEDDATPEATPRPTETEDGPGLPPARDPDSEGTPVSVNPDVEAPNAVTDAVREAAAREAGATEEDVTFILATPTEFPSSALGCPEPDTSYSDVIVPGYIVVVEVDGERYEFHTDATGRQLVLCEQPVAGRDLEESSVTADEALVQAASEYLSETTGLDVSHLTLVTAEEVEWPDASLGCPQSGMMYAQ